MNDNRTIKTENIHKAIEKQGYFYILAKKYYGEDYIGPKYIIATDDSDFSEKNPKLADMVIVSVDKFVKMAEAINVSLLNDEREDRRRKRHHSAEGYYEEIPETEDGGIAPLAIKDQPMNPVEDEVEATIEKDNLLKAIDKLSDCSKRRLYAYYYFGKTHREIAVEEGVNRNAVEKSIYCALKKLKKYF